MKYEIGLTENQATRVNDILLGLSESWGYKDKLKLKPIKETNREDIKDTVEYQLGYRTGYDIAQTNAQATKEEWGEAEYKRGSDDAWNTAAEVYAFWFERCCQNPNMFAEGLKIEAKCGNDVFEKMFDSYSAEDIQKRFRNMQTIHTGDEIIYNERTGVITKVYSVGQGIFCDLVFSDGETMYDVGRSEVKRTERNFKTEVKALLEKMNEE